MGRHYIVLTDRSGIILNPVGRQLIFQLICQFLCELSARRREFFIPLFVPNELRLFGELTQPRPTA